MWYNQDMAKKKRKDKPESPGPDPVQAALDAVEKATGEKLSGDTSEADSNRPSDPTELAEDDTSAQSTERP